MALSILIDKSESKLEDVSTEYYLERVGRFRHPMFIPLSVRDDRVELILGRNLCPSRHVSKKHASFSKSLRGSWFVKDLNSLNGVFKNKERIEPYCYIKLRDGNHIGLGVEDKDYKNEYYFIFKKKCFWIPFSEIYSNSAEIIAVRRHDENVGKLEDDNVGSDTLNFDPIEPFFSQLSHNSVSDQASTSEIKKRSKNNSSRVRMIEPLSLKLKRLKKSLRKFDINRFYPKRKVPKLKAKIKPKKKIDLKFMVQKLMGHRVPCPGGGSAIRK